MIRRNSRMLAGFVLVAILALVLSPGAALAIPNYSFAGPVFGLATAPDGSLLVADSGAGIVELRKGVGSLIVDLPGAADVSPVGRGSMFAITGAGDWGVYQIRNRQATKIADLLEFETNNNPDGNLEEGGIDSNPFDVEALTGSTALVADAGGNDLLIVDRHGDVDWVAALPQELVSTDNAKTLVGCPTPPADLAFVCELPPMIPTQAVATSVAIGPDGAYYVGELKGFPGPLGESRIWRIAPGTRHAQCGTSPACAVVADGFTSIVDLEFGRDGTLYVTEIDEASSLAVELELFFGLPGLMAGGTVNACNSTAWTCSVVSTGLTIPIATTVGKHGAVYALTEALLPTAQVIGVP